MERCFRRTSRSKTPRQSGHREKRPLGDAFHRELKQYDISRQQFDEILKNKNVTGMTRAIALFQRAEIDARLNKPDLVVKEMNDVLKADPLLTDGYKARARAFVKLGKLAESLPDFNTAINIEQRGQRYVGTASISSDLPGLIMEQGQSLQHVGSARSSGTRPREFATICSRRDTGCAI